MPNRILKESICTSDNIDQLSPWAEIAFYRLMVNCDDYGRMDARPKILKSRLFPLKDASENEIQSWFRELEDADLIIIYHHDGKPYLQMKTWDRHQQVRAKRSKYPSSDEVTCNQMISDDIKCPRNPIQSESESLSESESREDDAEALRIVKEHNRILDAAEDAGFQKTNSVRAKLIDLYADHGLDKVLAGIESCVKHGVPTLAYLEACLNGQPRKKKEGKNYDNQRSYTGKDSEAMNRMLAQMEAMDA